MIPSLRANSRLWALLVPLLFLLALWKVATLSPSPAPAPGTVAEPGQTPASVPASPAPAATDLVTPAVTSGAPASADPEAWHLVANQVRADQRARDTAGEILPSDFLERIVKDATVAIPLPDGTTAEGTIGMIGHDDMGIEFVEGRLSRPAPGYFFLQRQTAPGVAGPFVGNLRFDGQREGWKIEPTPDFQQGRFVMRDLDEILCVNFAALPAELLDAVPDDAVDGDIQFAPQTHPTNIPNPPHQTVIPLQSLPGATGVLYLDFDGEKGPFPGWGEFDAAPSGASTSQIFEVWRRVCEDFQGFNLNVTTDRAVFDAAPAGRRQQIIITPTNTASPGAGGVAYVGSYNWSTPRPCWSFYTTGKNAAEVISHELGHTLGLSHDGRTSPSEEYYGGHGSGDVGWAPIMGTGYSRNLTQWSKGEYLNANRTQDDLALIAGNNNVGYRADDCGDTLATARYLEILANNSVSNEGIIERTGDIDAFRFQTSGGSVTLNANVVSAGPNLDILAEIVNASTSAVISQNNPDTSLNASITTNLAAGEYLFRVRGTGRGDPLGTGYTNYASLGSYLITGTVSGGVKPDRFSIAENSTYGAAVGTVVPRNNHGGAALTYQFASGNTSGAFAIHSATGAITVANSATLNFEALSTRWDIPAVITPFVTITNAANPSLNETVRVVVTVTDVNEAPVLAGASLTVLSGTAPGAVLLTARATDPDRFQYPSHAITAGNSGGFFAIHSGTGAISAANSPIPPGTYNLTVTATDQGNPPLATSASVTVTVIATPAGLEPGSIVRTYFEGISGSGVSNLTNNARFPNTPDKEEFLPDFDGAPYGDNFGSTIRGYLIAPATGSYRFWIASDDASQLRFNSSGTSQSGASAIASVSGWTERYAWTASSSQQSAIFNLTAGQAYYIEARHKEGTGGDHVAVAWTTPLDATRKVIPGIYLAPFYQNYAPKIPAATYTVRENAIAGQPVGSITPTDVNAADTFSGFTITAGNTNSVFGIDSATGRLFVAKSGALDRATRASYSLTIRTRDSGSPALTGTGTVTVNVAAPDGVNTTSLVQQVWTGISGTALSSLTGNVNYPFRPSSTRNLTSGFNSGTNLADNYGSRIRAYVIPPTTGSYFFYLCTDDDGRLLMSNSDSASGAATIATITGWASPNQWDKYTSQKSAARNLTGGQKYYIEALQKEGGGGDHLQVAWSGPGIDTPTIIPATALEPFDLNTAPVFNPSNYAFAVNGSLPEGTLVGTVSVTDPEGDAVVFAITSGDPDGAFAIGPDGRITLANPAVLTNGSRTLVVTAQDGGIGALYPLKSATVNVTVTVTGAINQVADPVLSPSGGNHIGPLAVTATSSDGATIQYTLDGSDPKTSGTAVAVPSPAAVVLPAAAATTLKAYAFKIGMIDSGTTTATYQTVAPDALTWTNAAGGSWPVAGNWLYQVVAGGAGVTARFDTLALAANRTVTLDGSRTIGGLRFGDTSGQFSWTLVPGSGGTLTLDNGAAPPLITVNNGSATVTAAIAGASGLVKAGPGALVAPLAKPDLTGPVLIREGEVRIDKDMSLGTGVITLRDALTSGGGVRLMQRGSDVWPVTDAFCANDILVATGPTGRLVIGRRDAGSYAASFTGTITLANDVVFRNEGGDRLSIDGNITGNGNVIIETAGGGRVNWSNNANDFTGNLTVAAGAIFQPNGPSVIPVSSDVTLFGNIGTNVASGETMAFGALNGSGLIYRLAGGNPVLSIGHSGRDGHFHGEIRNDFSLIKTGAGAQILSGANSFTGATTVTAGVLLVDGSLASPATTTVDAGGTLGGCGTLAGPATVHGSLTPGSAGVGSFAVNQQLTLAPGARVSWDITDWTGAPGTGWDRVVAGSLAVSASAADPVTIHLTEAALGNFSETTRTFILIQTTSGITGFSPDKFIVNTSGLTLPRGTWAVQQSGNNLVLAYTRYNSPPMFTESVITGAPASQGAAYAGTLAGAAADPDTIHGDTLTFAIASGPEWLAIAPDGALTGTPENGDIGPNVFTVRVTDADGLFDEATLEIQVIGAIIEADGNGNGILDIWEIAMLGNADADANPADGDLDGDGLSNLLEYALNTHPLIANPSPVRFDLVPVDGKLHPRLTVPKNPAATNLAFHVEVSPNLGADSWSAVGTTIELESDTEVVVRSDHSTEAAPRLFLRLRVEIISPR